MLGRRGLLGGIALTVAVAVLIVAVVLFAAHRQNALALEDSRHRIATALAEVTGSAGRIAVDYGWWDEAYARVVLAPDDAWADENMGEWLSRTAGATGVFAVDGHGRALYAWPAAASPDLAAYAPALAAAADVPGPVTTLVTEGGRLRLAATSRLRPSSTEPTAEAVLAVVWDVEAAVLPRLRALTRIASLEIGEAADGPSLRIGGASGQEWPVHWVADRPGDDFVRVVLPVAAVVFAVLAAAAWLGWWRGSRHLARARGLEEARTRLLAAVGHDLRQPLQSLSLYAAILESCVGDAKARAVLRQLDAAVDRMGGLLAAILDLARLDMDAGKPHREPVALGPVLAAVLADLRPQAESKGLALRLVPTSLVIESSLPLLTTVLHNMVCNAIRYTEAGGVLVGCRRRAGRVEVWVCDTGIGIPAAQQALVFEEFFQVGNHERDARNGLGLGLAIVQRLCRALGHAVSVRSVEGKGSAFILSAENAR